MHTESNVPSIALGGLLQRRRVFFGGKGGVGKTTCASAFALAAAGQGKRVLLVSTDPAHSTADAFGRPIGPREREIDPRLAPGLWGLEIDPEREAATYIEGVKRALKEVVSAALLGEIERQVDIARVSPGAEEAALFDRVIDVMQQAEGKYDLVVFDTAPTGHTLRLLSLPELMGAWIDGMLQRRARVNDLYQMSHRLGGEAGRPEEDPVYEILQRRRAKFHWARRALLDPEQTAFVPVLLAERLPIAETARALEVLEKHGVPVAALIINRVLPKAEVGESDFWRRRRDQEEQYLREIDTRFAAYPRLRIPMLERDVHGFDALRTIGRFLF